MNKKGFTLVELIVVITILAILWTIGFISLQWYSKSARDSTRISDITSMEKILSLYKLTNNQYPTPVDPTIVTYSGSTAWTQWVFWKTAYTRNAMMSNVPLDPITALEYPYSVTADGQEYQLAAVLENPIASLITSSTYAGTQEAQIYTRWNYNGKFLRVIKDDTTYLLWVPSIIASDFTSLDLEDILISKKLVYKGHKNLPVSFSWSVYDTNPTDWFDFWWAPYVASGMILFAWDTNDLATDPAQRVTLLDNLQASYSWTTISSEPAMVQLLAVNATSNEESSNYVATALNNSFKTNISTVAVAIVPFICWDTVSAWWETYTTIVWLDWNCWTSQNMRHWTMLANWFTVPTNDNIIEKWCPMPTWTVWTVANIASNCITEWWLYTWNEAMWYWTTGNENTTKSVCWQLWTWWKLPRDIQWTALTTAWATWWTWNKLWWIMSSLPGAWITWAGFDGRATSGYWWSSTENFAANPLVRFLYITQATVDRYNYGKLEGFSVACIKAVPPTCATQPWYSNTTFTEGTPTTVNQTWQNINNVYACYYLCTGWGCIAPSPYANCTWVNTPTPFSATTTYGSCDTADIIVCDWVWSWYTISACNIWSNAALYDAGWYWESFQWWNNAWIRTAWTSPTQIWATTNDSTYSSGTFITTGTSDWTSIQNDNMWWDTTDTDEARIWPCEVWYHVPTTSEWTWIHTAWWWWTNWLNMSYALKIPMAGRRNPYTSGSVYSIGSTGYYWSSSPNGTNGYYMSFGSSYINPSVGTGRANGYSVRCFKN
jgi:prepilin-type N-terminal cleavage/methylation domain-containing protein/uncharacterized protein (TIGR02145 family)